ncbi:hypothetical protein RFI_28109 [Reticulomyxa filosa]|uniref:Uncharacterized protein n=1 Tax=Reticulomyxa filosa TaxID=46433 RepID=X6M5K8_RETFI|nr:hypothetical protein RFI_28109 [Reticulomyxa filosa]|eukprot:ETO09278.1 hypothetical protein RFI_28109 [Reticulomyxa filosa]
MQYLRDQRAAVAEQLNTMFFEGKHPAYFHAHHTNIEGWYDPLYLSRELVVEKFKSLCNQVVQQMARSRHSPVENPSRHPYSLTKMSSNETIGSDDRISGNISSNYMNVNDVSLGVGRMSIGSSMNSSGVSTGGIGNFLNPSIGLTLVPGIGNVATNSLLSGQMNVLSSNGSPMLMTATPLQQGANGALQMPSLVHTTTGNTSTGSMNALGGMGMMSNVNQHVPSLISAPLNFMNPNTANSGGSGNANMGGMNMQMPFVNSGTRIMNPNSLGLNIHSPQMSGNVGSDQALSMTSTAGGNLGMNLRNTIPTTSDGFVGGSSNSIGGGGGGGGGSGSVIGSEGLESTGISREASTDKNLISSSRNNNDMDGNNSGRISTSSRKRGNIHVIEGGGLLTLQT